MTDANGSRAALLSKPVQIWLLLTVVGAVSSGGVWLGSITYAQAKAEAKDAKAAVEKAEARLVDALKEKKADDSKAATEIARRVEKQEARQEEAAARQHEMDRKLDLLIQLADGEELARKRKLSKAEDFRAAVKPP